MAKRRLTDFTPDDRNANKGTERGLGMLETSLRKYGAGRSILVDRNGKVIAGNKTLQRAVDIGLEDAIVVPTDGKQLVVVQRVDVELDSKTGRELALADNRVGQIDLEWDADVLASLAGEGVDLSQFFFQSELDRVLSDAPDVLPMDDSELAPNPYFVPDARWATDNEYDIPVLDTKWMATSVELPCVQWARGGAAKNKGTWHFYVDDAYFEHLWLDPAALLKSNASTIIEPNFSTNPQMPRAVGLWMIYRKRWLARFYQSCGMRVIVDCCVSTEFADWMFLGVPKEWRSFATRWYTEAEIVTDYERVKQHIGCDPDLFVVYAGGKEAERYCKQRGWVWIAGDWDAVMSARREAKHG